MKILHSADWHLGDNFHGYDRKAEHDHFLEWLKDLIVDERPDALLVSGDIYDNANPSAPAQEELYRFLADATAANPGMTIVLTAGNHDSGRRLQAPTEMLRRCGVEVRGMVDRDNEGRMITDNLIVPLQAINNADDRAVVLAIPYLRTGDFESKKSLSAGMRSFFQTVAQRAHKLYGKDVPLVLMAHFYAVGSEVAQGEHSERLVVGGEDCVSVEGMDRDYAYVALGHIHKAQQVGGRDAMMFYAGSPIPMSFAEKNYRHGVNKITLGPGGGALVEQIAYTPLRQLQSIPQDGAAPLSQVLDEINQLPKKKKEAPEQWRYLEIRLLEKDVNPVVQNNILAALDEKAVRLCRLIRVAPQGGDTVRKDKMLSLDQLRNISPLDIAMDAYFQATNEEMDDELTARFKTAMKEAQRESAC